jgi:hypothetical protein
MSIASPLVQPSPNGRRVGIRIVTFEACSGFTRVTARRIAQPPKVTFVTRLQPCQLPSRAARQLPVPFPTRFQEGSGAVARGVSVAKRRVPPGDGPNGATIQDRADSPGATISFLRSKAPSPDMCPGETAATDAQWGDRAFERQYRNWMGLRWLVCVCVFRVHDQQRLHGADQREVHHARRTKMVRRY